MATKQNKSGNFIVCGKFDNNIPLHNAFQEKYKKNKRIMSTSLSSTKDFLFKLIATDGKYIWYKDKNYDARDFVSFLSTTEKKNLMVLTYKEKSLLLEIEVELDARVSVFEEKFPVFDNVVFFKCKKSRIKFMERGLLELKNKGIVASSLGQFFSGANLYRVERKLRFSSPLEKWFGLASMSGYQDVFKLYEERNDRVIIALDFNSMYPSCMKGEFADPRLLKYKIFKDKNVDLERLQYGIYRVNLKHPKKSFFRSFHPFKYVESTKSFHFNMQNEDVIQCLLFKNEIEAYKEYFDDVEVIDGIISKKSITHPLYNRAKRLYSARMNYRSQNSALHYKLATFELQTMHSSTSKRHYKNTSFKSIEDMDAVLSKEYGIDLIGKKSVTSVKRLLNNKNFLAYMNNSEIELKSINLSSPFNIFSLSSQVVANSRIKMIKTIEKIISIKDSEICYANTDSLHISVKKENIDFFLNSISNLLSDEMGYLKVECIAERGYWFDIGRYWLKDSNTTLQYKNKFFRKKTSQNPYTRYSRYKVIHKMKDFSYVTEHKAFLQDCHSFNKRINIKSLDHANFERYDFVEVKNLDVADETYENEALRSKLTLVNLFNRVATDEVLRTRYALNVK
ncbi:hypothetical protein QC823_14925 [Halomonas vilamensis]|uniref:DNA-directed DNA polymerase n=1 Tax=Vreelandella vilamensis TaxID=531309 RepID=A0ABU1H7H8_9GAMM|nr:hypothetical protein [Halomonas vilamensis]MDR5900262.1 hypothetical protein [Halomonas vilamensis]